VSRRRVIKLGVPLIVIAAIAASAWAYFSSHGTSTASASVGSLHAPTNVSVPASSAGTVHVTWTASTLASGGAPTGYYVTRIKNSDSSTANACGTSPGSPTSTTSCDDTVSANGTYHYTVTAVYHSWSATSGSSGNVTVTLDSAAPTATITFPSNGGSYNASGWAAGCSSAGLCGSASDSSGVSSVKVSIKRSSDGAYWNGSAFSGTTETFNSATLASPGGTATTWRYALSVPADGSYVVHVQTADTVGNAQSGTTYAATSSFTIDTASPAVAVTKVNGGSVSFPYSTNQSVTSIGGTCGTASGDGGSVSWSFATQSGTATCSSGAWTSGAFTAVAAEGTYAAHAAQSDAAGNSGSDDESVKIDKTKPVITATATKSGGGAYTAGTWTNQSVTVSFSCAEAGSVQSGIATNTVGGGGTQSSETSNGSFTNTGTCTDAAGNAADSVTFSPIKIDKTKPVISATATAGASAYTAGTWTNQSVTVSFSCAEAGAVQSGISTNSVGGGGTQTADTSNGSFKNTGACNDVAGNTADANTFAPIQVDKTNPAGSLTAPSAGTTGGAITVSSNSADPLNNGSASGVASAQFQVAPHNGSFSSIGPADTSSPYSTSWDTTSVANGSYDLRVVTTDNAGNTFTSAVVTVTVSNTFQVTASSPQTAGAAFNVTITAKANGATNTNYTGSHTMTFSGPANAPDGTTPTYPASVSFTNGVGTASVTLVKAEATTLTATSGNVTGTSGTITVNAGTSKGLVWSSQTLSAGTETCATPASSCTITGVPKNQTSTWTSKVSVIDQWGNATVASGAITVTVTPGVKGAITGSPLTIASGASQSSTSFTYTTTTGVYTTTITATGSGGGIANSATASYTTI
jgi:hypothetical protein